MHEKICQYCGVEFNSLRSDAKFHSNACRIAWNKLPHRISEKTDKMLEELNEMRGLVKKFPHLKPKLDEQLTRVQEHVARLRLFPD